MRSKYGFPNDRLLLREGNIGSCTRCVVSLPGNSWNVATDHKTDLLCRGPDPAQVENTADPRYRNTVQQFGDQCTYNTPSCAYLRFHT